MDGQPRLTDLVPRNLTTFAVVLVAGLAVIAALEFLYAWMPRLASMTSDGRVATFDLDGEGSLAVWFSSITLALAGLVAILVYTVRRHKIDDYPGHYRIWLWAAMCWLLMSLDETSSLHEGFKEMMVVLTGDRVVGDGSVWWVAVYFFLLGAVGTRLLIDMRRCLLSSGALLLTAACYALAVATQLGWFLPEYGARAVMVEEGAEMLGNVLLLLAMGLHARHVILDAEGRVPKRRPRAEEPSVDETATDDRSLRVHPPHGVSRPAAAAAPVAPHTVSSAVADDVTDDATPQESSVRPAEFTSQPDTAGQSRPRKLTKAERKALRKRLAKMKAEREGRTKKR
jgi:hypothetical protein